MADRPKGYGMTAELQRKKDENYDFGKEAEARQWIEVVIGETITTEESSSAEPLRKFHLELKDGTVLCKLINQIKPGSVKKFNTSKMAFKQMENIGLFLEACYSLGVAKTDLFQTVDLYEASNMGAVVNGIHALGRKAQSTGYNGPTLGAKEATQNKREFTEQQMQAGKNVIGLQMGTNKGASQAGMTDYGARRQIMD